MFGRKKKQSEFQNIKDIRELIPVSAPKKHGSLPYVELSNGAVGVFVRAIPVNFDLMDDEQVIKTLRNYQSILNAGPEYLGNYRSPRAADLEQQIDYLSELKQKSEESSDRIILEDLIAWTQSDFINAGTAAEFDCAWILTSPPEATEDMRQEFFDNVDVFLRVCERQRVGVEVPTQAERDAIYMRFSVPTQAVNFPTSGMEPSFMPTIPGEESA